MLSRRTVLWLGGLALIVVVVGAVAILSHSSSSASSAANSTSAASYGTVIDQQVPSSLRRLPLTNQHGQKVDLASWPGKTVVLVPFLTLCSDICPLTTGNLVQVERSLRADHAASHVQIVELTVDPGRDIPARLAAYAKLTGARFQLVTERPSELAALSKFFGFSYEKVPEDKPPSIDWWTGKPLTYDINHSDNYFVIDPSGSERVVQDAAPDFHGHLNPKLHRFLSGLGLYHLKRPPQPDWTPADVLQALGLLLHQNLPVDLG
jgi:cytochrome oxidase Cu insertion factor (SCO1/SenC/PrrC family)